MISTNLWGMKNNRKANRELDPFVMPNHKIMYLKMKTVSLFNKGMNQSIGLQRTKNPEPT